MRDNNIARYNSNQQNYEKQRVSSCSRYTLRFLVVIQNRTDQLIAVYVYNVGRPSTRYSIENRRSVKYKSRGTANLMNRRRFSLPANENKILPLARQTALVSGTVPTRSACNIRGNNRTGRLGVQGDFFFFFCPTTLVFSFIIFVHRAIVFFFFTSQIFSRK